MNAKDEKDSFISNIQFPGMNKRLRSSLKIAFLAISWFIVFGILFHLSDKLANFINFKGASFFNYLTGALVDNWLIYCAGIFLLIYLIFLCGERTKEMQYRAFNFPMVLPLLNVLALLIGIYTSVTSAEILKWINNDTINKITSYGGFDYCLFGLFFLLIGYGMHGLASKYTAIMQDQTHKERLSQLEKVIRLAPPGDFSEQVSHYCDILEDWSSNHIFEATNKLAFKEINETVIGEIEEAIEDQRKYIRAALTAFARMAGTYDNAAMNLSSPDTYRANLMFKMGDDGINYLTGSGESFRSKYYPKINVEPDHRLVLDKRYSVRVDDSDNSILKDEKDETSYFEPMSFDPDSQVKNLILPVFTADPSRGSSDDETTGGDGASAKIEDEDEFDYKTYNMLGAPRALVTGHPQFVFDAEEQVKGWLKDGAPRPLYEEAKSYFQRDEKGKSIISLPLLCNRYGLNALKTENISGSLNIYRNTKNIFSGDDEKFYNFFYLTSPALVSLSRIVELHTILLDRASKYRKIGKS